MTRVLIVDDQPVFRRHLRRLLAYAGLAVVGEAGDISEADQADPFRTAARRAGAEAFISKDDLDLKMVQMWKGGDA